MCVCICIDTFIHLWSNRDGFCPQNARLAFYSNSLRVQHFNSSTYAKNQLRSPFSHDNWSGVSCRFPCLQKWPHLEAHPYRKQSHDFPTLKKHLSWLSRNGTCCLCTKQQTWLVNSSKNITKSNMFKYVPMWFRKCHNTVSYAATSGLNLVSSKWHCNQNDVL